MTNPIQLNPNIAKYPCRALNAGILPLPTRKNYEYKTKSSVHRFEMDMGLETIRRRTRNPITYFSLVFRFSGDEKMVFSKWIDVTLDAGVNWFYLPLLISKKLETVKCRFVEIPGEENAFTLVKLNKNLDGVWESRGTVQTTAKAWR